MMEQIKEMMNETNDVIIKDIIQRDHVHYDEKEKVLQSCDRLLNLEPVNAVPIEPVDFYKNIFPGSQIAYRTDIPCLDDFIWHHAIYDGNERVIHMTIEGISVISVKSFMRDAKQQCVLVEYENDNDEIRHSTRMVANYYLNAIGSQQGLYSIGCFNCEHFATVCRTGKWRYSNHDFINRKCCQIQFITPNTYFLGRHKLTRL